MPRAARNLNALPRILPVFVGTDSLYLVIGRAGDGRTLDSEAVISKCVIGVICDFSAVFIRHLTRPPLYTIQFPDHCHR